MPPFETYAKRRKRQAEAGKPDVYQYEQIPQFLRKQVWLAMSSAIGPWGPRGYEPSGNDTYEVICQLLERELETFPASQGHLLTAWNRCEQFVMLETNVDNWLSIVEVVCGALAARASEHQSWLRYGATQRPDDALNEINDRFREHGFGYRYENGIMRVDEQYVHAEIVKPALSVLSEREFSTASEEFMTAHRHYRSGEIKDAIVAANRAFESTLKAICKINDWEFKKGARASDLVTTVRNNGLFPDFLGDGLNTYIALMKTGLPEVRNQAGGHGAHPDDPEVPKYLASYAIHLTGANILLVVAAHKTARSRDA